jgi:hypothetical protein
MYFLEVQGEESIQGFDDEEEAEELRMGLNSTVTSWEDECRLALESYMARGILQLSLQVRLHIFIPGEEDQGAAFG